MHTIMHFLGKAFEVVGFGVLVLMMFSPIFRLLDWIRY